jgi:hypothetical protein
MIVKLREVNGAKYMLINKPLREILGIDKEVDIRIENNNIIVSAVKIITVDKKKDR